MADTVAEKKETTPVESPEKKEKEKEIEKVPTAEPEEKAAENGDAKNNKENGSAEEKSETAENGEAKDACSIKRKSTGGGDATEEDTPAEGTPEKKAKLSDKAAEAESNGDSEAAKA